MKSKLVSIILISLVCLSQAADNSSYIDVDTTKYEARDLSTTVPSGSFTINNGTLHYWNTSDGYTTFDVATSTKSIIGKPTGGTSSNSMGDAFGVYNPTTQKFTAATIDGTSDAYIYEYDTQTGSWATPVSAVNAYGADTYGETLYFSGLNEPWNGGLGQENYVIRYEPETPNTAIGGLALHDQLIQTLGNSASMTVDNEGNIYYATYNFDGSALYKWDADLIASVTDDIVNGETDEILTLADATVLSNISAGANGITVDDGGNVFITYNDFMTMSSEVIMWNESMGIGASDNFETIATLDSSQGFGWFNDLDIQGNFLNGDALYGCFGFSGPITEIKMVPEPATMLILGLGGLIIRKKNKASL